MKGLSKSRRSSFGGECLAMVVESKDKVMGILQGIKIHDIMCEGMVKNKKIQGYVGWWKRVECKEKTNRFSRLVERVFADIPLFHKHNTLKILIKSDVGKLEHNMSYIM